MLLFRPPDLCILGLTMPTLLVMLVALLLTKIKHCLLSSWWTVICTLWSRGWLWYPVTRALHRFFIAIARVIANDDGKGGTAPDPFVWCSGAKGKRRKVLKRCETLPCHLDPRGFGLVAGKGGLGSPFLMMMMVVGPSLLDLWLSWLLPLVAFLGLARLRIWEMEESLLLSLLSFLKGGLGRGSGLRSLSQSIAGLGVQF